MQGVYTITGVIASVTTAKTLCFITTHATRPIEIYSAFVSCTNEDTSEQIYIELNRIATLGTPTSTTVVPKQKEESSANYGGVCETNVTASEPTYDAIGDALKQGGTNKLGGWEYVPLPEERVIVRAADNVGLRVVDAIANSSTISYEITFREIG